MRGMFFAAMLAIALPAPIIAQETGTLITRKGADAYDRTPTGARRTMRALGRCIVQRHSAQTTATLELAVNDENYAKRMDRLVMTYGDPCLHSGELSMSIPLLRASLIEALYVREFADMPPAAGYDALLQTGYRELHGAEPDSETRATLALYTLGECVARADPASAHRLTLAEPGSSMEDAALAASLSKLSGCVIAGKQLRLSKPTIKGAIAEGAWRLRRASAKGANAPVATGGGS